MVEYGKLLKCGVPKTTPKRGKDGKELKDKAGNVIFDTVRDKKGKIVYEPYEIKVLNTIDFSKSLHYSPLLCYKGACERSLLK